MRLLRRLLQLRRKQVRLERVRRRHAGVRAQVLVIRLTERGGRRRRQSAAEVARANPVGLDFAAGTRGVRSARQTRAQTDADAQVHAKTSVTAAVPFRRTVAATAAGRRCEVHQGLHVGRCHSALVIVMRATAGLAGAAVVE
jgi:hypothetical protein